jgi:hypothetical protein
MGGNPLVAKQRLENARQATYATYEKLQEMSLENRRSWERFYNNLALFSGGTIALSITFLGYLKASSNAVSHKSCLVVSWVLLVVCAVSSLFYTLIYGRDLPPENCTSVNESSPRV